MIKIQKLTYLILIIYIKAWSNTTDTTHNAVDTVPSNQLSMHQHFPSLELCIGSGYPWVKDINLSFSPVYFFSLYAEVSNGFYHSSQYFNTSKLDFGFGLQHVLNNYALFKFGLAFEAGIVPCDATNRMPGPGYGDCGPPLFLGVKILSGTTVYFTKKQIIGIGMHGFFLLPIMPSGDDLIPMAGVQIGFSYTIK